MGFQITPVTLGQLCLCCNQSLKTGKFMTSGGHPQITSKWQGQARRRWLPLCECMPCALKGHSRMSWTRHMLQLWSGFVFCSLSQHPHRESQTACGVSKRKPMPVLAFLHTEMNGFLTRKAQGVGPEPPLSRILTLPGRLKRLDIFSL